MKKGVKKPKFYTRTNKKHDNTFIVDTFVSFYEVVDVKNDFLHHFVVSSFYFDF